MEAPAPGPQSDGVRERFNRLSSSDFSYLRFETPAAPMHVGALMVVEAAPLQGPGGGLALDRIRRRIASRLDRMPELRRRLYRPGPLCGRPLWVDDPAFDIALHVRAAPAGPAGDHGFLAAAARAMEPPLDRHRPLWEICFLPAPEEDRLGVLLKIHHAIADGLGVEALMLALFDGERDAADPKPRPWAPQPPPGRWSLLADNWSWRLGAALRAARRLRQIGRLAGASVDLARALRDSRSAPQTSLNRPVRPGRNVRFVRLDLATAKAVAEAGSGKVNDVVLNLVAGGLRELLRGRREPLDADLVASVPVSLRPGAEARALGNRVGVMLVPLPVREPDPARRLRLIVEATRRAKSDQRPAFGEHLMSTLAATPLARAFIARQRMVNLFVTDVVGPAAPLYFLGGRVLDIIPIVTSTGNVTVSTCALSYAGSLYIAVTADASACPDIDSMTRRMEAEWTSAAETARRAQEGGLSKISEAARKPALAAGRPQ